MPKTKGRRGWFGDSAGHSAAGRKGGRARSQNQQIKKSQSDSRSDEDNRRDQLDQDDTYM